jgi:hypothetical protein
MMLERIGIIGKTQGVSDSSSPKPKKLPTSSQKLACLNSCAMRPDSSAKSGTARWCRRPAPSPGPAVQAELLLLRRIADAGVGAALRSHFQGQRQRPRAVALDRQADERLLVIHLDLAEGLVVFSLPGGRIGVPSCTVAGSAAKRNLSR